MQCEYGECKKVKKLIKKYNVKCSEEIDELKQIIKKQYEKNKENLSKMSARKYNNTIKKKLDDFIEDAEIIYEVNNYTLSQVNRDDLEKYFFSLVPRKQQKKNN